MSEDQLPQRDSMGRFPGGLYRYVGGQSSADLMADAHLWGWSAWALHGEAIDSKLAFIDACAEAMAMPAWQGRNWDALEETLRDLPDTRSGDDPSKGYLLIYTAPFVFARANRNGFNSAMAVLDEVCDFWHKQGVPFCVLLRRTYGAASSLEAIA